MKTTKFGIVFVGGLVAVGAVAAYKYFTRRGKQRVTASANEVRAKEAEQEVDDMPNMLLDDDDEE